MSSRDWESVKLREITSKITKGTTPTTIGASFVDKGINFIKSESITASRILDRSKYAFINEETHKKLLRSQIMLHDILFSMAGMFLGKTGIVFEQDTPANTNQAVAIIRVVQDVASYKYVYYYLNQKLIQDYINGSIAQSAQPNINLKEIGDININLPPLHEQKSIADTLSCLDDMIELNNHTNQVLEEIARTIFKRWFVDFEFLNEDGEPYKSSGGEMVESELGEIPKGWRVAKLEDALLVIEAGNRPKGGASNLDNGIPSIGAENIIGLGEYDFSKEKYVPEEYFELMNKGIVNNWDVMLYKDGAQIGRKTMFAQDFPHKKCCINSHVFILRCNDLITQPYLYFWLDQDYMTQNIINLNANSAQPGINQPAVKQLKILVPDKETINRFQDIVEKLLILLFENCKENRKLTSLRDTLLPKLMSGEIRVPTEEVV